ncbi:hypothetical protein [Candidatus Poriferisocius sp.]|uniref:hypothetical protein n=1 Tax=Candidatus Poriferisocius sp. TaxID=3101276 RepID=UPI003B02A550
MNDSTWIRDLLIGGSLTVVAWVGLAYFASAAGRRYERKLWPNWPHDAPTNLRLQPNDTNCSREQRDLYYEAISALVGLDIARTAEEGDEHRLKQITNDAVTGLRHLFRTIDTKGLLSIHNEDYGFTRNLSGLAPFWFPASMASAAAAWAVFAIANSGLLLAILASITLIIALVLVTSRRSIVSHRAERYADSFFGTLVEAHRNHVQKS